MERKLMEGLADQARAVLVGMVVVLVHTMNTLAGTALAVEVAHHIPTQIYALTLFTRRDSKRGTGM